MDKEKNTLLAKWLENSITPQELQQLQQEVDLPKLEQVLERQKQFDIEVQSNEDMWQDFQKRIASTPTPTKSKSNLGWIALIVFLFLATALALWFYSTQKKYQEIKTAPAKTETKLYADGTAIHISPNSSIVYDEEEWEQQRNLTLKGQAYFNVVKSSPFVVLTAQGKVEALGTQFDIWTMGNLMRVQCFEGEVKVSNIEGVSTSLSANQQIIIRDNKLNTVENFVSLEADWMKGNRVYQKIPLRWVIKDLERFYNIQINASAVSVNDNFGGIIPINDLNKALEYLTKSVNWTYEIENEIIYFRATKE